MDKQNTNETLMENAIAEVIIHLYEENIGIKLNGDSNHILQALLYTVNQVMADNNVAEMNRINDTIEILSKIIEDGDYK